MRLVAAVALVLLVGCGPSDEEKAFIAQAACAYLKESNDVQPADRVERINQARRELHLSAFTEGDEQIERALQWDTCTLLVLNGNWSEVADQREAAEMAAQEAEFELQRQAVRAEVEAKGFATIAEVATLSDYSAAFWNIDGDPFSGTLRLFPFADGSSVDIPFEDGKVATLSPDQKNRFAVVLRGYALDSEVDLKTGGLFEASWKSNSQPYSGIYKNFHKSGELFLETYFDKGKAEGTSNTFYSDGTKSSETTFHNALKHGEARSWWPGGSRATVGNYKTGKKDGVFYEWWPGFDTGKETCYSDGEEVERARCK
jgi:hypothetical protein